MRAKQMLATMSHEIRSPLSGVVSMAEILSTTKVDQEQRQLLDCMLSSGDLVLQLINDILDLSKVESGLNFIPSHFYSGACSYCIQFIHFTICSLTPDSLTITSY
jgi:signal transduction histidine kinase